MANLRIDDTRRVAPGQAPGSFSAPDASRGAEFASRQLQQTGQAVSQAGKLAADIWTREAEAVNEARVNDALNRAQVAAQTAQTEWSQLQGEAAIRVGENQEPVTDVYAPRFERQVGEIADEMGLTAVQRERYAARVQPLTTRYRGALDTHFATQSGVYKGQVYESGVAVYSEAIRVNWDNPDVVSDSIARIRALTADRSRDLGLPSAAAAIAERNNVGGALLTVVKDLADEDVVAAEAFFTANEDSMTAQQRDEARTVLMPAREARTANTVADMFGPRLGNVVAAPGGASNYEQTMASVWASEGTALVPDDNGAGRARYGITENSHPEAWADGDVTREEADAIYRSYYWDYIGGDNLPAGLAHIAMDAAVNQGRGAAREMLAQADGDVAKFADLRRARYRATAANDRDGSSAQFLDAWLARADKVEMEALGQTPAGSSRAPTMTVTQAVAAARAELGPGAPPSLVRQTEAEVRRRYTEFDRAEAEGFEAAQTEAYKYIDDNKAMPPASVLARLKPGALQTVRGYLETTLRPAAVNSDPEFENFLIANPDQWEGLTRQEFAVFANGRLNPRDLANYQRGLYTAETTANAAAQALLADLGTVNATDFAAGWRDALGLLNQTPARAGTEQFRDQIALQQTLRTWVAAEQRARGRVLTPTEIADEIKNRVQGLTWNASAYQGGGRRVATSFSEMSQADKDRYRRLIPLRGGPANPSDADIFRSYSTEALLGN
jgi:hypothetical protein